MNRTQIAKLKTQSELRTAAKQAGYSPGWAYYVAKARKAKQNKGATK